MIESGQFHRGDSMDARIAESTWYTVNLYNSAGIPARPAVCRVFTK